jgi:hypothetical protein
MKNAEAWQLVTIWAWPISRASQPNSMQKHRVLSECIKKGFRTTGERHPSSISVLTGINLQAESSLNITDEVLLVSSLSNPPGRSGLVTEATLAAAFPDLAPQPEKSHKLPHHRSLGHLSYAIFILRPPNTFENTSLVCLYISLQSFP